MPTEFSVEEAKERLSELLDRVETGEDIVITRFGAPSVSLNPVRNRRHAAAAGGLFVVPVGVGGETFDVGTDFWPDLSG